MTKSSPVSSGLDELVLDVVYGYWFRRLP